MKVAVIGCGAIGGILARALHANEVAGAELVGVVHEDLTDPPDLPVLGIDEAIATAELVVECAGQQALVAFGPSVLAAGKDLLVVSVGALAEEAVFAALSEPASGRVHLCTGAVGGLDLLSAAARMGGMRSVRITTTKLAANLVQPWMAEAEAERVRNASEPVELMCAPAREVTAAFPKSANVAASVALAVGDWESVEAVVVADPAAGLTEHVITAETAAGSYRFEIRNHPSEQTPTTSGVVPYAVLRAVESICGNGPVFR